jgi:hypothetical protein
MLNIKRLRSALRELNMQAGGRFSDAHFVQQEALLHSLEIRDPAFFQEIWTLATYSYYTRLALNCDTRTRIAAVAVVAAVTSNVASAIAAPVS